MDNTLYFNPEWMEALECLSKETRDKVISAIVIYQTTGQMPELTNGKSAFMFMKIEVDRRNRRLAADREKRAQKKRSQENPESETPVEKSQPKPDSSPEITPEKKAAIGSLLGSLMQPRQNSSPKMPDNHYICSEKGDSGQKKSLPDETFGKKRAPN